MQLEFFIYWILIADHDIQNYNPLFKQKDFLHAIESNYFSKLLSTSHTLNKARLMCTLSVGAVKWLNSFPIHGNKFTNIQFSYALRLWLGLNIIDHEQQCKLCDKIMDTKGYHAMTCLKGGNIIRRHNAIRNIIAGWATKARWSPVLEKMAYSIIRKDQRTYISLSMTMDNH